jgi:PAS domain S-box-containing protein
MDPKRIFIVEDEGIIANRLKSTLEIMGYQVCGATTTGESAVEMVLELKPDLVLMDIHLAGKLNGIDAAGQIHSSLDVPIIYSTAYSDNFFLEKAKSTDPYSFLVKPIQDRELYAAIEMALYRHEIDKQLAESEERYRIVSEIISDFAFSVTLEPNGEYRLEWITPVFTELTGFTIEEINNAYSWKKLVSPTDYEIIEDINKRLLEGEEVSRELRILKRNRELIWINLNVKPIWNESRTKIIKVYGAAQDITQRKYTENELLRLNNELELRVAERTTQLETAVEGLKVEIKSRLLAEENLIESEERYRNLTEYSPDAVTVTVHGKIIYVNPAAIKLVGASSKEELIGKTSINLVHPDYFQIAKKRVEDALSSNLPQPIAHEKLIRLDGTGIDVEIILVPINYGNEKALLLILRDITEKREAESQLRKLSRAVEQSPAGILITDISGDIQYVNPKFIEITGYTSEEVINCNPRILKSGDHDKEYYESLWKTILTGNEWRGEIRNRKKSGELYWEFLSISSIKNAKGDITHFLAVKEDITERKNIEAELIKSKVDAEEANNLKSSLLANMSHELRTPLNGILGFSQLLKDELSEPDHINMLGKIAKSGKRLMNTLNSVLMLTELENNNYLITLSEVDLVFFCRQIKTLYGGLAQEKKLSFNVEIKTENIVIETDENLLTKIISNLVENAIKYTNQGSITIELNEYIGKDKKRFALINVIDTGIGIKRENQDIIFREFKQLSEGFRRDFEGLGLGLSISKKMANLINVEILVESAIGVGSIFTVTIPVREISSSPTKHKKEIENILTHKQSELKISKVGELKKVLLVEDNPLNIEVVQRFLSKNYEVIFARDGDSALKMLTQNDYKIFMIDINLGHGIDGIQVLKGIRKIEKYKDTPVIALTGYASDSNRRDFLQQGFSHYLAKPFEKKELLKILNELFGNA